ncbi:MAG: hypothetical protein AABW54_01865 [Candidatus Micrarchaeota archaeon]
MKIAFVDVGGSAVDGFALCSKFCEENIPDIELARLTAPDLLKIPVACKKAFNESADAIVAFATASGEEGKALDLVSAKILDVEVEAAKYAFFVVVFTDERSHGSLQAVAREKLEAALVELVRSARGGAPPVEAPQPEMPLPGLGTEPQEESSGSEPLAEEHGLF